MSIIPLSPGDTSQTPVSVDRAVLVHAAALFGPEQGSHLLRRALVAAIVAETEHATSDVAVNRAMYGCDARVRAAGREADRLIDEARGALLAAEMDGGAA
ncbi:hypothetical protein ABZW49_10840 [Nonomuraea wenchangensis]